jgi:hypothetical protein
VSEYRGIGENGVANCSLERSIEEKRGVYQDIVLKERIDPDNN